ncbi:MAG: hypothetical protein IPL92_18055 [Saprospiraceae bacterium]|nr:hypothetical protein [Candidatus Opimibacter iunctus]
MLRWLEYLSIVTKLIWILVLFFDDQVVFSGVVLLVILSGYLGLPVSIYFYAPEILKTTAHPEPPSFDEFVPPAERSRR